jgi:integrase
VRAHHASRSWTTSIGKQVNNAGTALRPKDWYFKRMTKAEATDRANHIQRDWEFLVRNWERLYAPTLRLLESPFADIPHWQPSMSNRAEPTAAEIEEVSNPPVTVEDLMRAYGEVSLRGVYSLYEQQQEIALAQGDMQKTAQDALLKSLRSSMRFFPDGLKMVDLSHGQIQEAKSAMLKKLGRRTVKNRMGDLRRMLKWFYDSDYGKAHEKPSHFEDVFTINNAVRADVKPYPPALLATLLGGANEREQLYVMLALNCGMYQSDIGRLTLDEINVDDGYVFWDCEKEPENPFKVRHDLWPETLRLARKFIQPRGKRSHHDIDHRSGNPDNIDCSTLAFVDGNGNMLYRITASGKAYDKISKAFERLNTRLKIADAKAQHYKFNHLRKSTNQLMREAVGREIGQEKSRLVSIEEISQMFLAQRVGLLARLYSQTREISSATVIYSAMNRFLKVVGDEMRKAGVFDVLGLNAPRAASKKE